MATKTKKHKKLTVKCSMCGKAHTRSQHLSHGKGSFARFPSRNKKSTKPKTLTKAQFLRRINKGRKQAGLKPIKAKK